MYWYSHGNVAKVDFVQPLDGGSQTKLVVPVVQGKDYTVTQGGEVTDSNPDTGLRLWFIQRVKDKGGVVLPCPPNWGLVGKQSCVEGEKETLLVGIETAEEIIQHSWNSCAHTMQCRMCRIVVDLV
jgi:hypothetical protein